MVRLPRRFYDHIVAHANEGWPNEVCGLLAGQGGRMVHAYSVKNVADDPRVRYHMDAADQFHAMRDMDAHGWDLDGIYHSHPATAPIPSATDRAMALDVSAPRGEQAQFPGAIYFIVSLRDRDHPELRAWRIHEETNVEEAIEVIDG